MAFNKLRANKSEGFTLVELLIVIVVIAILAAITIIAYNGVTQKARTSQSVSAANSVQQVAEIINTNAGHYPIDVHDFTVSCLTTKLPSSIVLEGYPGSALTPSYTAGTTVATDPTAITNLDNNSADSQNIGYLATSSDGAATLTTSNVNGGVVYHWDYSNGNITTSRIYVGSASPTSKVYPLTNSAASFSTCS